MSLLNKITINSWWKAGSFETIIQSWHVKQEMRFMKKDRRDRVQNKAKMLEKIVGILMR